jgi:hypothetical protein
MFFGQCWEFRFGGGKFGNKGMERMTWGRLSRWEAERREFEVDGFGLNFDMRSFEASEEDGRMGVSCLLCSFRTVGGGFCFGLVEKGKRPSTGVGDITKLFSATEKTVA